MSRAAALVTFVSCVLACVLTIGCAAPGDPTARHPLVPVAVTDLTARQSGNAVVLTFTPPHQSIDREPLSEPPSIEIYRVALSSGAVQDRKTPWRLVYAIPSERVDSYVNGDRVEFRDPLTPADLSQTTGFPLTYMVRTRAVKSRASADSNVFTSRVYPPPDTPRNLRTSMKESGIELFWSDSLATGAGPKTTSYHVYRVEIGPGEESAPQDISQAKLKSPLTLQASTLSPEFNDTRFEFGHTYLYSVRAVAQYGADAIESADSAPAVVTARDIFPPATPVGLEATIIPATAENPAHVELSWAISSEADLAGYYIYRGDREDTPGERINREALPSPTFRDTSVVSGKHYFYRVSAIDRAANESPGSSTVEIEVP